MSTQALAVPLSATRSKRIESIDLLRGIVMIIMALDHVRDYFHGSAYVFDPTDLSKTSVPIFFTRWITHFCAPVFMLLAGVSACLYGAKKGRKELSFFLFTRGIWLILAELFIVTLEWTFNPHYAAFILQVIWAFGISMLVLSLLIWLPRQVIGLIGIVLIAGHNLLDKIHVPGNTVPAFFWAFLHEQQFFSFGPASGVMVGYPILPWIGIICIGYCLGNLYLSDYTAEQRKKALLSLGSGAIVLFILLRFSNLYGDHALWSTQKNAVFTLMSFLNTTKYPPSLLYVLMTTGPALVFLALAEKPLNALARRLIVFGRVPMFYYLAHIFFIHLLAIIGAVVSGYPWSVMVDLTTWVTANPQLKGYGFNLLTVYIVWIGVVIALYPLCRWFDRYKRAHQAEKRWLSYL
jgi:uncharacterized membrane protein